MINGVIETKLMHLEKNKGRIFVAVLVSTALLAIAAIYVRPAFSTVVLGKWYAELSEDPFSDSPNRVGYRILTPLISYLLGLRGEAIIITNLLIAFIFLVVTYCYLRKTLARLSDTVYGTAVFAFSLVTLTTIYYGGYCDSLTYLLILLMWVYRSNKPLQSGFLLLGLMNRESVVFLIPWFLALNWSESQYKMRSTIDLMLWYILAFVLYYLFRLWISSFRTVDYTMDYYLGFLITDPFRIFKKSYGNQILGFFTVFKLFWIIVMTAVWSIWKQKKKHDLICIAVLVVCVWAQQFIAWDSSRMMTMAFPLMFIAILKVFNENLFGFRSWAVPILALNFLVPQLYTAEQVVERMHSTIGKLFYLLFFGSVIW
jgi:hypothetical protein